MYIYIDNFLTNGLFSLAKRLKFYYYIPHKNTHLAVDVSLINYSILFEKKSAELKHLIIRYLKYSIKPGLVSTTLKRYL